MSTDPDDTRSPRISTPMLVAGVLLAAVVLAAAMFGYRHLSASNSALATPTETVPEVGPDVTQPEAAATKSAPTSTGTAPANAETPPTGLPSVPGTSHDVTGYSRPPATNKAPAETSIAPLTERAATWAKQFMESYARPPKMGPGHYGWWSQTQTYLTKDAQKKLKLSDPEKVPFTKVTGKGRTVDIAQVTDGAKAVVEVPTDDGMWVVTVVQDGYQNLLVDDARPKKKS